MIIETSTLKANVNSIAELKEQTARTSVSDILAKKFGHDPKDCEMWNGNLFVYCGDYVVLVYDYFTKERKMYDFKK